MTVILKRAPSLPTSPLRQVPLHTKSAVSLGRRRNFTLASLLCVALLTGCASGGASNQAGQNIVISQEAFEKGDIRLQCGASCSGTWGWTLAEAKRLFNFRQWKDLFLTVARVGFEEDLSYYYIGRAAEGEGYFGAALEYYKQARNAKHKCAGLFNNCGGFVFPRDIDERVLLVEGVTAKPSTQPLSTQANVDRSPPASTPSSKTAFARKVSSEEFSSLLQYAAVRAAPGALLGNDADSRHQLLRWKICSLFFSIAVKETIYRDNRTIESAEVLSATLQGLDGNTVARLLQSDCRTDFASKIETILSSTSAIFDDERKITIELGNVEKYLAAEKAKSHALVASRGKPFDILGLIAGSSTKGDVEKAVNSDQSYCSPFCMRVGGFNLQCDAEYDENDVLLMLTCWFGNTVAGDNNTIFGVLEEGFNKKFGKPRVRLVREVRNGAGARFTSINPKWRDGLGNTLEMASIANRIDEGAFALRSMVKVAKDVVEEESAKKARKF